MRNPEIKPSARSLSHQLVRRRKDARILHAQPDQIVDVEEAPVIDLLARHAPERQPVRLLLQQLVQRIEAPRISRQFHSADAAPERLARAPRTTRA